MITVHGRWVKPDGTPAVGRIGLQLAPPGGTTHAGGWVQQTEPAQIVTTPVQWVDLVDGQMSTQVMASDDPSWHQPPRHYVLVFDIDGQPTTMGGVLLMSPGPIDLSDITPMPVDQGVMVVPVPGPPNRLTVDAVSVDPDQPCTATISGDPPNQHIRFGLAQGAPGESGPATALTVDAVAVNPDQPCTATISGDPPEQHIRFGLAQGMPGKPGPATALTVDAVTVDPDQDCTATISGVPPKQHIRFELARGAPGVCLGEHLPLDGGGTITGDVTVRGGLSVDTLCVRDVGNRVTAEEWVCADAHTLYCAPMWLDGSVAVTAQAASIGIGFAGSTLRGDVPVEAGQVITVVAQARQHQASQAVARARIYWWVKDSQGNVKPVADQPASGTALTTDWTDLRHTGCALPDAIAASLFVNVAPAQVGEIFEMRQPGIWLGAGGEPRPPGELIPGLGKRLTRPTPGGWYEERWIDDAWVIVDGDTGKRAVGNGHCQRVANMVTWTASDVAPPTDWRPALGVQPPPGAAYMVASKWPTTYPGSPAR